VIRNGRIEISLGGIAKFFGVILAATGLLAALTALAFMLPPLDGYSVDRQVTTVQGNNQVLIVDVQETPGLVLGLFTDTTTTRYIHTNKWYSYETGQVVDGDTAYALRQAYRGFLLREQADAVLAENAEETVEVTTD